MICLDYSYHSVPALFWLSMTDEDFEELSYEIGCMLFEANQGIRLIH